jgi:hypothetical protein
MRARSEPYANSIAGSREPSLLKLRGPIRNSDPAKPPFTLAGEPERYVANIAPVKQAHWYKGC